LVWLGSQENCSGGLAALLPQVIRFGGAFPIDPETGKSKRAHPHMFRDTFAVEMLLSGASMEQVQTLLGHKSIKTTEKSYVPWVRARQDMLD
jgi:integrase